MDFLGSARGGLLFIFWSGEFAYGAWTSWIVCEAKRRRDDGGSVTHGPESLNSAIQSVFVSHQ